MSNQLNTTTENYEGFEVKLQAETRQLASRQDHSAYGSYEDGNSKIYWTVTFDGPGKHQAIEKIRRADLNMIMKSSTPWLHLQVLLESDSETSDVKLRSGSTMVLTKIHILKDEIQVVVTNIGDSRAVVFVNHVPVFVTTPHSSDNASEIVRLIKEKRVDVNSVFSKNGMSFEFISPTTLRTISLGTYVCFKSHMGQHELAMTQSLGHNGITGLKPDTTVIHCKLTDHIHVCMCTDGVTDIIPINGLDSHDTFSLMTSSTTMLLDEAERRWKQTWFVQEGMDLRRLPKTKFPKDGYDDCSCTMLTVQPILSSETELPNEEQQESLTAADAKVLSVEEQECLASY
jgi:serine/threonine protein phosphatase PrpC